MDRNGLDLTEAEDIKKTWQEYKEELYKKDLHDSDNHDGVITNLEADILECEVKWALESIPTNKASGGDGIPVELFQILKDGAVKVLHSICQIFLVAQIVKCLPTMWETQVRFLGWEDPLEKEMAIHSSTLALKIPWTEEPDRLQSMGSQRVGHD